MSYETLETSQEDGVLTLTLSRPDRLNALNTQMLEELLRAFDEIDADDAVRAVIVTGAGRAFCAGADLGGGGATFDTSRVKSRRSRATAAAAITLRIYECRKPVIAAINGAAVGVGATMTLPMDVRIASEKARFGFVFARRGIVPEAASSWFLPRVVGISQAMEWVATGRVFPARGGARGPARLARRAATGELLPAARALAREIADNTSGVSVALSRQLLWKMLGADHPMEAHKVDSRLIYAMGALARRLRGRAELPREAPRALHDEGVERHARRVSVVGGAEVRVAGRKRSDTPGISAGSTSPWRLQPTRSSQVCGRATSASPLLSSTRNLAAGRQPSNQRAELAPSR